MTTVDAESLEPFAAALLEHAGASRENAEKVAASLVLADLRGHTSHGVLRVPTYAEMIEEDALDPVATPAIDRDDGATATVDGRLAFGQVVGREATRTLVDRAREHGVAAVGVRNATHLGRMGEWAERAADAGVVFGSFVNAQGAGLSVAAAGSAERTFSTNPVTFGIPTYDALPFPILLDMATSQVAHGKIEQYEADDDPLPEGWGVTADGEPTTDPSEIAGFEPTEDLGAIRPLGGTTAGYKGTGLAVVVELLAGIVGNAPVVGQTDPEEWFCNAAAFVAIDPSRFVARDALEAKVESVAAHLRSATSLADVPAGAAARGDDPLLPGEAEHHETAERREDGIPVPDRVVDSLVDMAAEHGVEVPAPMRD